jgi:hypothetical protein
MLGVGALPVDGGQLSETGVKVARERQGDVRGSARSSISASFRG